jgi:fructose-1,6-bisphosphatase II
MSKRPAAAKSELEVARIVWRLGEAQVDRFLMAIEQHYPGNEEERRTLVDQGFDLDRVLGTDDLVSGREVFFAATGVTDGSLLRGVKYWPDGATTYSMVMRSQSGTVRYVEAQHQFAKLERFSAIPYRR